MADPAPLPTGIPATQAAIPLLKQEGWQLLQSHLDLVDRFSLVVVVAPDEWTLEQIRRELKERHPLGRAGREITFQPLAPPRTLTEQIFERTEGESQPSYHWVSAPYSLSDPDASERRAWDDAFTYLNQNRNRLRKQLSSTLIIAGTLGTLQSIREFAPDLWSIRSGFIQFAAATPPAEPLAQGSSWDACLATYKRSLLTAFRPYQELAIDNFAGAEQVAPDIWDIFVHPACSKEHLRPEDMDAAQREVPPRLPAEDLLPLLAQDDYRRTVLLADPGMGKSTLIQSLVAHLASGRSLSGAAALTGLLPVPLILRDLVPHLRQDDVENWTWDALLNVFIEKYQRDETAPKLCEAFKNNEAEFRDHLHTSPAVFFLIDGLDEIGDLKKREQIVRCIQEGIRAVHKEARWLITSRVIGYEAVLADVVAAKWEFTPVAKKAPRAGRPVPFEAAPAGLKQMVAEWENWQLPGAAWPDFDEGHWPNLGDKHEMEDDSDLKWKPFSPRVYEIGNSYVCPLRIARRLYLAPFDDRRQDQFTQRWFRHRHSIDYSAELMREVRAHYHEGVRIISRVPNLLCMMNILKRGGKPLPNGRAALYDEIVKAYLGGIDAAYHLRPVHGTTCPFTAEQSRFLLAVLGAEMQHRRMAARDGDNVMGETEAEGNLLISRQEIEAVLLPEVQQMFPAGYPGGRADAADLLDELLHHIASRSGLLIPRSTNAEGETLFGFTHLSFLEFFAAEWLGLEFDRQRNRIVRQSLAVAEGQPVTEADLDREFPPRGPIQHPRQQFAELPSLPAWHEPLIFLLETRKNDAPTLLRWLFPALHSTAPPVAAREGQIVQPLLPDEAVRLAVALASDPEIPLAATTRQHWWRRLWEADLVSRSFGQMRFILGKHIIAPLLLGPQPHRGECLDMLAEVQPRHPDRPLVFLNCPHLTSHDLHRLAGLGKLEQLHLIHCTGLRDTEALAGLSQLRQLDLRGCTSLEGAAAFQGLAGLGKLEWLNLSGCIGLRETGALAALKQLRELYLNNCTGLEGAAAFQGLAGLGKLERLDLSGCTGLRDTAVLAGLGQLRRLDLDVCTGLKGAAAFQGLAGLRNLGELHLIGCTGLDAEGVRAVRQMIPNRCRMTGPDGNEVRP